MIKAAKLQYELYGNIHSYLTVWIAGYLSDYTIRSKFGSTRNLLRLFYNTELTDKRITPSWADTKRRINIPLEISEELAEETGIHIGDGNLYVAKDKDGFCSYKYSITGHLEDEYIYHEEHIRPLLKSLYNWPGIITKRVGNNTVETVFKSKAVLEFKNKVLKLSVGPKYKIKIPPPIIKDPDLAKRCLIGIFDTDFTLNENINIVGTLRSLSVIKQIHKILEFFEVKHSFLLKGNFGKIRIHKKDSINIIEGWGLNNSKHISKYELWKEFSKYIPFSKTEERLAILKNELGLEELEKVCEMRRKKWIGRR